MWSSLGSMQVICKCCSSCKIGALLQTLNRRFEIDIIIKELDISLW